MTEALDPRIQKFITERGKLAPVGVNCVLTPVQNGRYYVQAHDEAGQIDGVRYDEPYFGPTPFIVTRNPRGRDIVECGLSERVKEAAQVGYWYELNLTDRWFRPDEPQLAGDLPLDLPCNLRLVLGTGTAWPTNEFIPPNDEIQPDGTLYQVVITIDGGVGEVYDASHLRNDIITVPLTEITVSVDDPRIATFDVFTDATRAILVKSITAQIDYDF